jgi:phosphate starvation-inducible PhoH-like protein
MSRKKKRSSFSRSFNNNNGTQESAPRFTLKRTHIEPKSIGQRNYLLSIKQNKLTVCDGPAGCGKTLLAAASASNLMHENSHVYDHIVIVRPAVTACNEKLGYLPGSLESKMEPFTMPVLYSLSKVVGRDQFMHFMKSDIIKVIPLAYMRGLTLDNCIVIFDEAQNSTPEQMKMFLTRLGEDCKVIIEGDVEQSDIRQKNGLSDALERLDKMRDVGVIELDRSDVVRSGFVREVLERYAD